LNWIYLPRASKRSFVINSLANPPLYWLVDGAVGTTPGQGLYVWLDQHWPVEVLINLAKTSLSRPSLQIFNKIEWIQKKTNGFIFLLYAEIHCFRGANHTEIWHDLNKSFYLLCLPNS